MSADNSYVVRKHPNGGFTYVMEMGHAPVREAHTWDKQYADVWLAYRAAMDDMWTEYGISFHEECADALRDYWGESTTPL
jgi:hypothetical protein